MFKYQTNVLILCFTRCIYLVHVCRSDEKVHCHLAIKLPTILLYVLALLSKIIKHSRNIESKQLTKITHKGKNALQE